MDIIGVNSKLFSFRDIMGLDISEKRYGTREHILRREGNRTQ